MPKTNSDYQKQIKYRASSQWVELLEKGKTAYQLKTLVPKFEKLQNDNETFNSELWGFIISLSSSDFYRLIVLKWFFENFPELLSNQIPELIDQEDLLRLTLKK